ncbi:MAG: general secretion pathway protein GspK [Candidatus Omnitrophica bacterium]|nr:general secretion pathway protein GspK [Candidatus Omnitrophota bacterium]
MFNRAAEGERGVALLIVVSLLTVTGIMGVAFAFSMYLETQAGREYVSTHQARYLAEGGVNHARALLDEDRLGTRVDWLSESWAKITQGNDVDVDGDGTKNATWWPMKGPSGQAAGRYALHITDEAGKANLNAAQARPSPGSLEGVNLVRLLAEAGIDRPGEVADAIERYRHGEDARPGNAGIDDDGGGAIDEADEYQPLAPFGDDRRLEGLEELTTIAGLGAEAIRRLVALATVYSWDMNVSVAGQPRVNVNTATAAELLPVLLETGVRDSWQTAVNIADAVDPDLELSRLTTSSAGGSGIPIRGIEAIRFNELMAEPTMEFDVSSATFESQGSDWSCPVGSGFCSNAGVGQARWSWTGSRLEPGRYYVRVFASAAGQTVGEVRLEGNPQRLVHGQRHPATIIVGPDGRFSLTIGKQEPERTYSLSKVALSVQPDGEYVEFINLSDTAIEMTGWTIDGELTGGRQARLPNGSVITPHGLLVAAVDLDDTQANTAGNGIDARSAWEMSGGIKAVQLEFPNGAPSPDDDWLKAAAPTRSARLILRRGAITVDEVELPPQAAGGFQSLEKGDPTVIIDADQNGIDEGWFPSLVLSTPGLANDNEGLREVVESRTLKHDPGREIKVLNRPIESVGELAGLPSGQAWRRFSSRDLAGIADRLTVEGYRLEMEGRWVGTGGEAAWDEQADGYAHTDPSKADVVGRWEWRRLPDGDYRLSLYGYPECLGEQVSVRWKQPDGAWTAWSPALSSDAQGRVVIGQATIGPPGSSAPQTLTLEARCVSPSGICHLDAVRLDPRLIRLGPINVNTAPREVLLALPGMTEALASQIIAARPYGDRDQQGRGIGDLLIGDVLGTNEEDRLETFRRLSHLVTTRSEVFQILSLGQAMAGGRVQATQRIRAVVQR